IAIGENVDLSMIFATDIFLWFVVLSNLMLAVTLWFLMRKDKPATTVFAIVMAMGAAGFFASVDQLTA
ncbi:MAG: hypothetical protein CMK03_15055, partial [Ponticaulis sp.]|nr:hypothetical protein [Ponticaulis sp.]